MSYPNQGSAGSLGCIAQQVNDYLHYFFTLRIIARVRILEILQMRTQMTVITFSFGLGLNTMMKFV